MGKIEELLVNGGLYDSIDISVEDLDDIEKHLSKNLYAGNTIDCFCGQCGTNRIFEYVNSEVHEYTGMMVANIFDNDSIKATKPTKEQKFKKYMNRRYVLTYRCTRDRQQEIVFDLITANNKIMKIGQYPSVADLVIPEIAKYKSVLGTQYREFSKAVGLFAHGIGIGSFVYLRRIIENLVFNKFDEVCETLETSREEFEGLKFDKKIDALKNHLPEVLVSNKNVYGIVSKGIHELSEEECLEMFPYIKAGIELILDALLAEKERKAKEKIFEKFVAQKTGELK